MTNEYQRWIQYLDYGGPRPGTGLGANLGSLLDAVAPPKRKVFVSYQHANDQAWQDAFTNISTELDLFTNRSLQEPIDSDDTDYVHRAIRERNITGSSVTIVLCGSETWKRKWVDWEIGSTVNKGHALLGVALPTAQRTPNGIIVPDRYYHNWLTGYAEWVLWEHLTPVALTAAIERAVSRTTQFLPDNRWPFMGRNRS